ncbi:Ig-like domain-containing protein, partial [Paenibacillus sp. MAHUQ-46]
MMRARQKLLVLFHVLVLLVGMIPVWPGNVSADSATPDAFQKAYIPNMPSGAENGTVDVVNLSDFTVEKGKITVGKNPNAVDYNPNGTQVFITNGADSSVSVIDPSTDTVIATIAVELNPDLVTFNWDGSKAYVASYQGSIFVIDSVSLTVVDTIQLSMTPLSLFAAENKLYVTAQDNNGNGKLLIIDSDTDTVEKSMDILNFPQLITGDPQGTKLYIYSKVGVNNLWVMDTASLTVENKLNVSAQQLDVSTDGLYVYMPTSVGFNAYDFVNDYKYDVRPNFTWPRASINNGGLSTDEKYLYALDVNNSKLAVVDTDTRGVIRTIDLSHNISLREFRRFMASIPVATRNMPKYNVTFDSQGGSAVAPLTNVVADNLIQRMEPVPTLSGLKFGGWYKDADANIRWNFYKDRVTADVTLYAKWEDKKVALLHKAYIPSSEEGAVDVVDLDDLYIEKGKIRLGAYKDSNIGPVSAVLNPNLSQLFVGNYNDKSVSVIDTTTDTVINKIPVSAGAQGIAFNSDGSKAYVSTGTSVTVIDTDALSVSKTIPLPHNYFGSSVLNVGNRIYVSTNNGTPTYGALTVIDTVTDLVEKTEYRGKNPGGMIVNPQGTKVYAIDSTGKYVSVIDVATLKEEAQIKLSGTGGLDQVFEGIEISPDGLHLYVGQNVQWQGIVDVIDTQTNTVVKQLQTGGVAPNAITVSLDGTTLFVTNYSTHNMSVIDIATGQRQSYSLSRYPKAMGGFTIPTARAVKLLSKYAVTFDSLGGSAVSSLTDVLQGSKIAAPQPPILEGYTFAGWYKDQTFGRKWDFQSDKVIGDTTLYAKWSRPLPASTMDEPVPGTQTGSTAFATAVDLNYDFAVKISNQPIHQPVEGDRLSPDEPDVIRNYHLQDDVTGVGSRTKKYIALYIVDPNNEDQILYFSQFLLYDSNIKEDETALKPISLSPVNQSTDVALDAPLVITFNDPVAAKAGKYITVKGPRIYEHGSEQYGEEGIEARVEASDTSKVAINGSTVTINLGKSLGSDWHYAVNIDRGAFADLAGNDFGGLDGYIQIDRNEEGNETYSNDSSSWSFSTEYVPTAPAIRLLSPANGAANVPRSQELSITFDQNVTAVAGKKIWIKKSSDDSIVKTIYVDNIAELSVNGKVVTTKLVIPDSNGLFEYGTSYYVQIENGAFKNASDQSYEGIDDNTTWTFTTLAQPLGPIAISYLPAPGQTGVAPGDNLVLTFDQAVYHVNNKKVKIIKISDASVVCTFTVGSTNAYVTDSNLIINVKNEFGNSCLEPKTDYAVQIDSGAFRNSQFILYAGIADLTTWSFKTAALFVPGFSPAPVPEPGDEPDTTKLPTNPPIPVETGNHLVVKVSSSKIATPQAGDSAPSVGVINPYTPGNNIPGVDPVVNKYIGIYEVDSNNKVVKFTLIVLGKGDVRPQPEAAPELYPTPVPEPGTDPDTTKLPTNPPIPVETGNHLVVKVSSSKIATPKAGDSAPSVGVINPYTPGNNIPGVDPVVNKYIGIYEVDSNNKVVKF